MDQPGAVDAEDLVQVSIDGELNPLRVPSLPRPEPHPSGAADECADYNHQDPQADESEQESPNGEAALLVGVVAVAERIGVDIGDDHEADNDERRHDHSGNPGIEIDEHFLEAEEVPGRF